MTDFKIDFKSFKQLAKHFITGGHMQKRYHRIIKKIATDEAGKINLTIAQISEVMKVTAVRCITDDEFLRDWTDYVEKQRESLNKELAKKVRQSTKSKTKI